MKIKCVKAFHFPTVSTSVNRMNPTSSHS